MVCTARFKNKSLSELPAHCFTDGVLLPGEVTHECLWKGPATEAAWAQGASSWEVTAGPRAFGCAAGSGLSGPGGLGPGSSSSVLSPFRCSSQG